MNQKTLAGCLNLTTRRVRELKNEGLFPYEDGTKRYCLEKCVSEYIEYKTRNKQEDRIDKEKEQAEHERIKKEISILKLKKIRKELHEAANVEWYLSLMLINFRNTLESVPNKVAIHLVGEEDINKIISVIEKALDEVLDELSEYDPDKVDGADSMDDIEEEE